MRAQLAGIAIALVSSVALAQPIQIEDFSHSGANGVMIVKDPVAPLSFELPKGWILVDGARWGNSETTLTLGEIESNRKASLYYQYPIQTPRSSDPDAALKGFVQSKLRQRQNELDDYRLREESIQRRTVAGRPAISFLAEFTRSADHAPMNEYFLRLMGAGIKVQFFVTAPAAADLAAFLKRLDGIAETLKIPAFQ